MCDSNGICTTFSTKYALRNVFCSNENCNFCSCVLIFFVLVATDKCAILIPANELHTRSNTHTKHFEIIKTCD